MSYDLTRISQKTIDGIKLEWINQVDEIGEEGAYLYSAIERIVDWCEKVISEKQTFLWELCHKGAEVPSAVVEVADASKSKDPSFKLLTIYLEPRLILDCKDEIRKEDLEEITSVYMYALVNSLKLAEANGTMKLKIYGRTEEMRSLFDALVLSTDSEGTGVTIYRQSKWLVIDGKR